MEVSRNQRLASPCVPVALGALLSFGVLSAAFAAVGAFSIPVAPHGDAGHGSSGAVVPLTPETFLVCVEGTDGSFETADDATLLVKNVSGSPSITPLATPFISAFSGRLLRLSATRVLMLSAGTDGSFSTADDMVLLLDELGTSNSVTGIVVGALQDNDGYAPTMLSTTSAVMATRGADLAANTIDDTLALVTDLGGTNTVTHLPAERLPDRRARPTALTPTSFLVAANGADAAQGTLDDEVYLFTGVGSTNTRSDLNVPRQFALAPRQPVRLSATRAIVTAAGADGVDSTADDQLVLLDALGTGNTVTPIPVPHIHDFGSGLAVPLSPTVVVVATEGPDSLRETTDDQMVIVTGLGATNTVTPVTVGGLDEDRSSKPVRLSPDRVAFATGGLDADINNADDEVVVLSGVGGGNTILRVPLAGLSQSAASSVVPLSTSAFAVSHGGANGAIGTGLDDVVTLVRGVGGAVVTESAATAGNLPNSTSAIPQPLGRGRAVVISSGPDGTVGTGGDDLLRVITGLPDVRRILVTKLQLKSVSTESFSVKGAYDTDDASLLAGSDVTFSVANAAQTIPASRFKLKTGGVLEYKDSRREFGFITKLVLDPRKGKFQAAGKGIGIGLAANPDYVPVAVAAGDTYLADVVDPRVSGNSLKFP